MKAYNYFSHYACKMLRATEVACNIVISEIVVTHHFGTALRLRL